MVKTYMLHCSSYPIMSPAYITTPTATKEHALLVAKWSKSHAAAPEQRHYTH
jgi:hypothetical protein|eukprot:SAG25_NODE_249_length_11020_cov_5.841590_11_plen_52_part_00